MKVSIKSAVFGLIVAFAASSAFGQGMLEFTGGGNNVTFSGTASEVDAGAAGADATLAGAWTFDLMANTTADILLIDAALTISNGDFFNAGAADLGSDTTPPNAALLPAFPKLAADSWVTTPNAATSSAGTNVLDKTGTMVTHFDSTDEGPQTDFQFGRITLMPGQDGMASATLTGVVQTAASPTPIFDDFTYTMSIGAVPEPASMGLLLSALLGGLAIVRRSRRS